MNAINYLRKYGMKHVLTIVWQYKIDLVLQKIMLPFLKNRPLQNIILIESHNDFDCNGGAFYDYLIEHGYNKKYKIVWLLKHPEARPKNLPKNVEWVPLLGPSLRKTYYKCIGRLFLADCNSVSKLRKDQVSVYCTHGAISLKDTHGYLFLPDDLDYCFCPSPSYEKIYAHSFSMSYPNNKFIYVGFPVHDVLYSEKRGDLQKIVGEEQFLKVFLWMPTFRKGIAVGRMDTVREQKLGIPLIDSMDEYKKLNDMLKVRNALLIIKIHPMQDLSDLHIYDTSNIRVLTGRDVKRLQIDNYRLMKDVSALISDYSSAAYDFLHCNKPIAYMMNDVQDYKLGLVVSDPATMMAGHVIYNMEDFYQFIDDVVSGNDMHADKRIELCERLFQHRDGNSCQRLVDFLKL